jgi:predicted unusual protein kinase regulating ubiquinone biosynthesis (AarF/ABC1/UbiB family)
MDASDSIYGDSLMRNIRFAVQDALDRHKLSIESDLRSATSVSTNSSTSSTQTTLSFLNIPYHEFIKNPYEHLRTNQSLLSPQIESLSSSNQELLDEVFNRAAVQTGRSARELLQYFDGMLSVTTEPARTTYHNFIKGFFLTDSTPVNFVTLQKNKIDRDNGSTTMQSYLDWIAVDKHQLFTLQEKGKTLEGFSGFPAPFYRKLVGVEKPKSLDDLVKAIDLYWQLGRVTDGSLVVTDSIVSEAISSELEDFFLEEPKIPQLWRLLVSHGEVLPQIVRSSQFDATLLRYLRTETEWPENPVTLCSIYRAADALSLFPDEGWRAQFTNLVMQRIDHTEDPHTRIAALEKLLLGAPLKDVDMREGATSRWVECIANLFGPDDTQSWQSPDCSYLERLRPVLDRIANKGHPTIRESLLRNLGNTIVAQRQVSHALEKAALGSIDETSALGVGQAYGGLQTILTILGSEEAARLETITFLIRPLSPKALAKFAKDAARQAFDSAALFSSEHPVDEDSNHYQERIKLECKRFYDNFWQAPMAYRAILLQDLLMPAQNRLEDFKAGARASLDMALGFAISELLPLEDAKGNPNKYATEAQRLLKAFLAPGVLDHRQQPVFLSALMAAAQRSNYEGNRLSVGQRLAIIFDGMGPAWKKFGQAVANHPNTPPDISRDMEPLKGKRSTSRSEAWALYEETVPETIRLQNPRLGPVLESASFFTAVDAGDDVFTLLTPNALVRAEDGFSIMENFVAELRKADDEFSQIAQPVSEMVRSARTSAALETNGRVGAAQAEAMRKRYEGLVVHIGDEKYPVSTAIWRDHGPEFRRMQKMKGPTFNDLPAKTLQERLHKRAIAKAILYVELRNILSGGAFCVDRHGRNMRVDGKSIGHFDHGAVHAIVRDKSGNEVTPLSAEEALRDGGSVEITEATEAESLQLADALYSSFEQLSEKQSLAVVMHNEIEKARATTGKTPEYLIRVERALLALNDCFKCLDPEGHDIKDILASLYLNGEIHKTICTALEKRIKREKLGTFGMFANVTGLIRQQLDSMIKERVTTSQNTPSTSPASRWHDYKQKRRDYPSLLTTKDFVPRRRPDADDPTNS